jgi:hypothetical protein
LLDVLALSGGTTTANVLTSVLSRVTTLETDFFASTAAPWVIDGIYSSASQFQQAQASWLQALQSLSARTIQEMASVDAGVGTNPPALQLVPSLQRLIQQMTGVASVNASVVAAGPQTALGTPAGNAVIVTSVKQGNGLTCEYAFPETLTFQVSQDAQSGATKNQEPLLVSGLPLVTNPLSYLWPGGSGARLSFNAVDGSVYGQTSIPGNILQNSDFFTYTTANQADNWTYTVGTAGTDWFDGTASPYVTNAGAIKITGTAGALLDAMTQTFGVTPVTTVGAGGTSGKLAPDTVYHLNCWVKCSATPATGVLEFSLVDNTGATMNDDQAVANLFTKSLTAVSTSYVNVNGVFRTPAVLPNGNVGLKLKVRLSTAIDSGKSVYISRLALSPAVQLYAGGPFSAVFSGNSPLQGGNNPDTWTVAITNAYGAFQKLFERLFSMRQNRLQLPSSGAPTIIDGLIA